VVPSTRLLEDLAASRDDRFLLGETGESGDRDGKEVKTFGDAGTASPLLRLLLEAVLAIWDVERFPRMAFVSLVSILV
jgi:hypothetical protein